MESLDACVFISYRRDDEALGLCVRNELAKHVGEARVYFDQSNNFAGDDFWENIKRSLETAQVVVCVIGPKWQSNRLNSKDDFVAREIRFALEERKPIIPLLVDGTQLPPLPPKLQDLAKYEHCTLRVGTQFHDRDMATLVHAVLLRVAPKTGSGVAPNTTNALWPEARPQTAMPDLRLLSDGEVEHTVGVLTSRRPVPIADPAARDRDGVSTASGAPSQSTYDSHDCLRRELFTNLFLGGARTPAGSFEVLLRESALPCDLMRSLAPRLRKELSATKTMEHPNLHRVIDVLPERGLQILEPVDHETLAEIVRLTGALSPGFALVISREVLKALDHASGMALSHLSINPTSVLLAADGRILLTGLGFSALDSHLDRFQAPRDSSMFAYRSPEAALGRTVDQRADLFAVGVLLWELIAGRELFWERRVDGSGRVDSDSAPGGLSALRIGYAGEADTVLAGSLARAPTQRFRSATEMLDAVEHALANYMADATQGVRDLVRHARHKRADRMRGSDRPGVCPPTEVMFPARSE